MPNYIQLHFTDLPTAEQEILIAQLSEKGFEGFEEGPDFLNACIAENVFDEPALRDIIDIHRNHLAIQIIAQKNWNEEWERSFEPVIIGDFCAIRAVFHQAVKSVSHELIITPKMSFGTGHHATTYQVIQFMQHIRFAGKKVLDFGTGTGVLAILAEKLGAESITAIDNDEWSINNANENILQNQCSGIDLILADCLTTNEVFDVILANLNKHVILRNLPAMAKQLQNNGVLILSGLLKGDEEEIADLAFKQQLILQEHSEKSGWITLWLRNVKVQ